MNEQVATKYDWDFIMTDSEYNISLKLLEVYEDGDFEELGKALIAFKQTAINSARHELKHELKMIMQNIILWKISETYQTQERREEIYGHHTELELVLDFNPCISHETLKEIWDDAFDWGVRSIDQDLLQNVTIPQLTWNDVFETDY